MFRILLGSSRSACSRPPPALRRCQQYRQYRASPPAFSATGTPRTVPHDSIVASAESEESPCTPEISGQGPRSVDSRPKRPADRTRRKAGSNTSEGSESRVPSTKVQDGSATTKRMYKRRSQKQIEEDNLKEEQLRAERKAALEIQKKAKIEKEAEYRRGVQERAAAKLHQKALREAEEAARRAQRKLELEERQKRKSQKATEVSRLQSEVHPEDPVDYLRWAHAKQSRPGARADKKRVNLISQDLADEVLERLKPSLEKHVGCDIVDINPGTGIWSSKLHDYLKPRNHILLEPDEILYRPLLKPLLDSPNSKYTLIPKSGIVWRHLEEVLTKNNLPFQEALERDDARLEQPNNSLLVVANLGFYPRRPYRGFSSMSQLVIHQLLSSVVTNSLFQQYGRVRMLIWIGDNEASKVLPKSIMVRRKSSIEAEVTCESIREIASSTKANATFGRDVSLELDSVARVMGKMEKAGVKVPSHRESDALKEFKERVPNQPEKPLAPKLQDLINEYFSIKELQKTWFLSNDDAERAELMEILTTKRDAFNDTLEDTDKISLGKITIAIDNRVAMQLEPPLLLWDRREEEPLKVHPKEFYPHQGMTLLDLQPKALWPVLRKNQPENFETFEFIISQLMMMPGQPLKKGLESLAPGAFEWLVDKCPLLSNPTMGGSLDPGEIRVRMLTLDMMKQIIEAWVDWPFRPTRYELISRVGSAAYDATQTDEDGGALGGA